MSFRDVQRLRTFALVLDLGSISAAATVLGYTQSAVSQQLAALERETGAALVDRAQRPLRATPAGTALRPHVDRVLAAVASAEATADDLRGGARRACGWSPSPARSPRSSRRRCATCAEAARTSSSRCSSSRRRRRSTGCAPAPPTSPSCTTCPASPCPTRPGWSATSCSSTTCTSPFPPGHRLARRETIGVADLEGEPLILPPRDRPAGRFAAVVEHLCAQAGFAPRVAYELDDLPAVQAFVAAGVAVVPMHGLTLATLPPGVVARPLAERPAGSRTVEALVPAGTRPAVVDDLLNRLAQAANAYTASALRSARPSQRAARSSGRVAIVRSRQQPCETRRLMVSSYGCRGERLVAIVTVGR